MVNNAKYNLFNWLEHKNKTPLMVATRLNEPNISIRDRFFKVYLSFIGGTWNSLILMFLIANTEHNIITGTWIPKRALHPMVSINTPPNGAPSN